MGSCPGSSEGEGEGQVRTERSQVSKSNSVPK